MTEVKERDPTILELVYSDIIHEADRNGGVFPDEWPIGRVSYRHLVKYMRKSLTRVWDGQKCLVTDDEPPSVMVCGVVVRPLGERT
jgi:hypothetical protein